MTFQPAASLAACRYLLTTNKSSHNDPLVTRDGNVLFHHPTSPAPHFVLSVYQCRQARATLRLLFVRLVPRQPVAPRLQSPRDQLTEALAGTMENWQYFLVEPDLTEGQRQAQPCVVFCPYTYAVAWRCRRATDSPLLHHHRRRAPVERGASDLRHLRKATLS